jgi:arginine deiminase
MPLGAYSEVGKLRKVMVHRPGLEHTRLTPSNAEERLFDDVLWVARAKAEHDMFCEAMRDRGVEVFEAEQLLAEALASPEARDWRSHPVRTRGRDHRRGPGPGMGRDGGPGAGGGVPDRRDHQDRRPAGRRAGVGVG